MNDLIVLNEHDKELTIRAEAHVIYLLSSALVPYKLKVPPLTHYHIENIEISYDIRIENSNYLYQVVYYDIDDLMANNRNPFNLYFERGCLFASTLLMAKTWLDILRIAENCIRDFSDEIILLSQKEYIKKIIGDFNEVKIVIDKLDENAVLSGRIDWVYPIVKDNINKKYNYESDLDKLWNELWQIF